MSSPFLRDLFSLTSYSRIFASREICSPLLSAIVVGCFISGCSSIPSVGPDYNPPELNAPAGWSDGGTTPHAAEFMPGSWWKTLDDPRLDSILERALAENRDLAQGRSRVAEARTLVASAQSRFFPQLTLGGGLVDQRISRGAFLAGVIASGRQIQLGQSNWDLTGGVNWELDIFGGNRRALEAAEATKESIEAQLQSLQVSLTAEVVRNYFELLHFEKRLAIAEKNLRSQDESVEIADARFQAGLTSELDLAQAKAQRELTRSSIPAFRALTTSSRNALGVLLGMHPGDSLSLATEGVTSGKPLLERLPSGIQGGAPSEVLRQRPDIIAAERALAASSANVGVSTAELFPRFTLGGTIGLESLTERGFFDSINRAWRLGPSFSVPIFTGGRLTAELEAAGEQFKQAFSNYEQTVLLALAEADTALTAFKQEEERFRALQEALLANQRSLELSRELYQRGLVDFQRVLDSQRQTLAAEDTLAQSENQLLAAAALSYRALGYGWSQEPR